MENTELENIRSYGKKMFYIAIIAGLINFVPGILISPKSSAYFNWLLLGILAVLLSLLTYGSLSVAAKKDIKDIGSRLINLGWIFVAIGVAIVCSAFSEFYFVSWSTGIFNLIAAVMLIFPTMYFMAVIVKKTGVSIVP